MLVAFLAPASLVLLLAVLVMVPFAFLLIPSLASLATTFLVFVASLITMSLLSLHFLLTLAAAFCLLLIN